MSAGRERFVVAAGGRAKGALGPGGAGGEARGGCKAADTGPGARAGGPCPAAPPEPLRDGEREGGREREKREGGWREGCGGGSPLPGLAAGREGRQLLGRGGGEEAERGCC